MMILQDWPCAARPSAIAVGGFSADTIHHSADESMLEVQHADGTHSRNLSQTTEELCASGQSCHVAQSMYQCMARSTTTQASLSQQSFI